MSLLAALEHLNATFHLDVTLDDLTVPASASTPPTESGNYFVAETADATIWHLARFGGQRWSCPGVQIKKTWVWRGIKGTPRPAPEVDLQTWAHVTLSAMRENTVQALVDLRNDPPEETSGSRGDEADVSSARESAQTRLRAEEVLRHRLAEIDAALQRVATGDYGFCETTGNEIPLARLRANPLARCTLEAQERREHTARLFARAA